MGKLSVELGIELPRALLVDYDTLHKVEKVLSLTPNGPSGNRTLSIYHVEPSKLNLMPPHARLLSLFQEFSQGPKKTLSLFPDGSGSATSYASLPKLSSDIAVYGLNSPWQKTP